MKVTTHRAHSTLKTSPIPNIRSSRPAAPAPKVPQVPLETLDLSALPLSLERTSAPSPSKIIAAESAVSAKTYESAPRTITQMEVKVPASDLKTREIESLQSPSEIADTAVFMASMLGPRVGTSLLDSSNLMTIAGLRTRNFYSIASPKLTDQESARLKTLNQHLETKGLRVSHTGNQFITDNLKAAERTSKENPWMGDFSASEGWGAYDKWIDSVFEADGAEGGQGALLGYPKQAIEDAKDLYDPAKRDAKMESLIRVPFSRGTVISIKPKNLENPEILAWQEEWGELAQSVYSQESIKPFLGEGEGKFSVPPAITSQHFDQVLLPALKQGVEGFQEASNSGKTLDQAFQPLKDELEVQGISQDFFSPYNLLYQGQRGVEPQQAYSEIFAKNLGWKTEVLQEAIESAGSDLDFFKREHGSEPNSAMNYPKLIEETKAKIKELESQLANPGKNAKLP